MTDRIAAEHWTLDQFPDKAREIRRRLLRWHESLPLSVGVNIQYEGQVVRVVPWHEYLETSRETFQSRLHAGHGQGISILDNPYVPGLAGAFESGGQYKPDQTEYVLRDFREHLAGDDPELESLRVAFSRILDVRVFSVHPLGIPQGQTIAVDDIVPGKTLWTVSSLKIDPKLLNDFVEAAVSLVAGPESRRRVQPDKEDNVKPGETAAVDDRAGGKPGAAPPVEHEDDGAPQKHDKPDDDLVRRLRGNSRELILCLWGQGNVARETLWQTIWLPKATSKRKRLSEEQMSKTIDRAVGYLNGRLEYLGYHGLTVERNGGLYFLKRPQN